MRLAELVQRVPSARLATADDNARILAFFDSAPMHTSAFALRYRRSPDFFRLLGYQGGRAHVVIFVDDHGDVRGLGTISLRPAWVGACPTTVCHLGDLRIGFYRPAIERWRRLLGDVIAHAPAIEELADCTHWLTTIMDDNHLARRVLVTGNADAPACAPIAPFVMQNVVARTPLARRSGDGARWCLREATPADRTRLIEFFEGENRRAPFGFRDELARRLGDWDGLALSDFIIASIGETIVACAAPWCPSAAKQMVVSRLPLAMRVLRTASMALPAGALRVPGTGDPLRVAYLTHLTFASVLTDAERLGAFSAMLEHTFDRWPSVDWHCLAFADFPAWNLSRALRGYIRQTVPITIYAMTAPGTDAVAEWSRESGAPPAFEMAIV